MSGNHSNRPAFLSVSPRFVVNNLEQALAFYEQLGFQTTYRDEGFVIVERDAVALHLNYSSDVPKSHSVCWISVTRIDELYQQYLPTNAVCSMLEAKPWGLKEFFIRDPYGNLILFAERIPEVDAHSD
ncbi:MAG TPA: VOC family protein [Ktedonobacteraceae bacterium]|nr:VOC family protein [Ktedonobacteraceae bacterium]